MLDERERMCQETRPKKRDRNWTAAMDTQPKAPDRQKEENSRQSTLQTSICPVILRVKHTQLHNWLLIGHRGFLLLNQPITADLRIWFLEHCHS